MSHTPGEWRQDGRLVVAGDYAVAMVNIARDVDTAHADARLISAAPDLLRALQTIAAAWDSLTDQIVPEELNDPKYWEAAHNAIAKAEGRS